MFIDTHAHLDDGQYDADREQVIKNAKENGVDFIINPSFDLQSAKKAIELAANSESIFAAVGCHPKILEDSGYVFNKKDFLAIIGSPKVVAIGECGLEGADEKYSEYQEKIFKEQVILAKESGLPLIVHCRNAHKQVIGILSKEENLNGVIHCFSGSWADAQKYLDIGFYLSFTGIITYAIDYDKVIQNAPLDRIMIETDCPYLAPVPFRGQRNEPAYVKYVAQRIAEIRGETLEKIAEATTQNAFNLFGLGKILP